MFHTPITAWLAALGWLAWLGCAPSHSAQSPNVAGDKPAEAAKMSIKVSSEAFSAGGAIPERYAWDRSPPLAWSGVPDAAKELALICDDPDAPSKEPWVHWVFYGIPASVKSLAEGISRQARPESPAGAMNGVNSWPSDNSGYRGPNPPKGNVHHYHFHLYALDAPLNLKPGLDKKGLLAAIKGHILAEGELIGTYESLGDK